jgi:hypothetical protein
MSKFTLERTDTPPLVFEGERIAQSLTKWFAGTDQHKWFDVAVYHTTGGEYVVSVEFWTSGHSRPAHQWFAAAADRQDVEATFRRYDPAAPARMHSHLPEHAPHGANAKPDLGALYELAIAKLLERHPELRSADQRS